MIPSDATANGISWISSWRRGVVMRRTVDPPVDGIRERIEQKIKRIAIRDVAVGGVIAQLLLSLGASPVDAIALGPQDGPDSCSVPSGAIDKHIGSTA